MITGLSTFAGVVLRLFKLNNINLVSPAESFWIVDKDLGQYLDKGFGLIWYGVIQIWHSSFGQISIIQLRLLSAIVGILIVVLVGILAVKVFSFRVGVYSSLIASIAIGLVISSRLATMIELISLSLLLGILACLVIIRGLGQTRFSWVYCGLLLSLSIGLHLVGLIPVLISAILLGYQIFTVKKYQDRARYLGLSLLFLSILIGLLGTFLLTKFDWQSLGSKTVFSESNPILAWLGNIIEVFSNLFVNGLDQTGYYFGQLSVVELNLGVLAIVGLVGLYQNKQIFRLYLIVIASFWILASLLNIESSFGWLIVILVSLIPLAGYGLNLILLIIGNEFESRIIKLTFYGLVASTFVVWFGLSYQQVFLAWPESQATYQIYREDLNQIANQWIDLRPDNPIIIDNYSNPDLLDAKMTLAGDQGFEYQIRGSNIDELKGLKAKQIYITYQDGSNDLLIDQIKFEYKDQVGVEMINSDMTNISLYYLVSIK